jgi:hypothetical protein
MDKETLRDADDSMLLEISARPGSPGVSKPIGGYLMLSYAILRKRNLSLSALAGEFRPQSFAPGVLARRNSPTSRLIIGFEDSCCCIVDHLKISDGYSTIGIFVTKQSEIFVFAVRKAMRSEGPPLRFLRHSLGIRMGLSCSF